VSNSRQGLKFWIDVWWPVACSVAVVAISSSDLFSSTHSGHLQRWLFESIFGKVRGIPWDTMNFWVRKSGHFCGYGFIGLAWLRAWWMTLPNSHFLLDAALGLLGCATMASLDEWHQAYIPSRTGSVWDVLLDCTGAITLQLATYIFMRLCRPKRLARAA
jgi:VanZ family protein